MHHGMIRQADELTAARITNLWNEAIGDMLDGLRSDLSYVKAEGGLDADELRIWEATERALYGLDSGEQHGEPREVLHAVEAWLAYYFRSTEEPAGMDLAKVYRLAAELTDAAFRIDQLRASA